LQYNPFVVVPVNSLIEYALDAAFDEDEPSGRTDVSVNALAVLNNPSDTVTVNVEIPPAYTADDGDDIIPVGVIVIPDNNDPLVIEYVRFGFPSGSVATNCIDKLVGVRFANVDDETHTGAAPVFVGIAGTDVVDPCVIPQHIAVTFVDSDFTVKY
jgi:hypothetical protein